MKKVKDIKKISLFLFLISALNADIKSFLALKTQDSFEIKNPFFDYVLDESLSVDIILNDRVRIKNKWYRIGEYINSSPLKIVDINGSSVFLQKDDEILELKAERKSHKILIK